MRAQRRAVVAAVGLVLLMTVLLGSASAQSDPQLAANACGAASPSGDGTIMFTTPGQLKNAECRTLRGKKLKDGCHWNPPELVLGPDQQAIEARQVSANFSTCATVVEIGTPTVIEPIPANEQVATEQSAAGSIAPLALYHTTQAYIKVTWWDPLGIDVNHVRSILNWTWGQNGCIVGSTASSAIYSQLATGWSNYYWNWWKETSCQQHYTRTDADFQNPIFCGGSTTYTHYRNVWIRGGYQGGYGGNLDSTWANGGCVSLLHWNYQVVKEWSN